MAALLARRHFLRSLGALTTVVLASAAGVSLGLEVNEGEADAAPAPDKIRSVRAGVGGTSFELWLDAAPFPCQGAPYTDSTVVVFVPARFRSPRSGAVDLLVHFHGHSSMAGATVAAHSLREQLVASDQNVVLVAPQGPVRAADGSPGKLNDPSGLAKLLREVLVTLGSPRARRALGASAVGGHALPGRVALSAHSGGYRAAAACVRGRGVDLREVYLFDSLYGEGDAFADWLAADGGKKRRKLVCHYVSGEVRARSLELEADLERRGVRCAHDVDAGSGGTLSRARFARERAIFVEGHAPHEAVVHASSPLKAYLRASCFQRVGGGTPRKAR